MKNGKTNGKRTGKNRDELLLDDQVRHMIAERAYFLSESEGFPLGREMDHWVRAEFEIVESLIAPVHERTESKPPAKAVVKAPAKTPSKPKAAPKK